MNTAGTHFAERPGRRSPLSLAMAVLGAVLLTIGLVGWTAGALETRGSTVGRHGPGPPPAHVATTRHGDARWNRPSSTTTSVPPATSPAVAAAAPSSTSAPAPPPVDLSPLSIRAPSVGIEAPLVPLGLNSDGTLAVPADFAVAGWYVHRPVPGEPGPSVIAGHVDSRDGPGAFYRLGDLGPGDAIEVPRADGSVAVFAVTLKEQHAKAAFPTERVYGPTASPELRLITCGGDFDDDAGHYVDNVIVFAALATIVPPPIG